MTETGFGNRVRAHHNVTTRAAAAGAVALFAAVTAGSIKKYSDERIARVDEALTVLGLGPAETPEEGPLQKDRAELEKALQSRIVGTGRQTTVVKGDGCETVRPGHLQDLCLRIEEDHGIAGRFFHSGIRERVLRRTFQKYGLTTPETDRIYDREEIRDLLSFMGGGCDYASEARVARLCEAVKAEAGL